MIENNVIRDNGRVGLDLFVGIVNSTVRDNTIFGHVIGID